MFRSAPAYAVAAWLLVEVMKLVADTFGAPDWVLQVFVGLAVIGIVPVVLFSWMDEVTPEGIKRESDDGVDHIELQRHTEQRRGIHCGIFVALQAENWNQGRLDRQLEQEYLSRLIDETEANLELLTQHEQIFEDKVQFILAFPTLPLAEMAHQDPDDFLFQLDNSSYVQIPALRSETYRELESSGRLLLLRDSRLRGAIASNLNDYQSLRPVFIEPIGQYRRMLYETLPGQFINDHRMGNDISDVDAIVASMEALRVDPRFGAAANAEIAYGSDMLFWVRKFKQRTEHILEMLRAASGDAARQRGQ